MKSKRILVRLSARVSVGLWLSADLCQAAPSQALDLSLVPIGRFTNNGPFNLSAAELVAQLDAEQFTQVHRSVVVNLRAISHVTRGLNETADIHLKGRTDVLPVSRSYLHLFRQM